MNKAILKQAVLAALREQPDFSQLAVLRQASTIDIDRLLRWLEISGLAFHVLEQLRLCEKMSLVPPRMAGLLEAKLDTNSRRMDDMFAEFRRVNEAFRARGIRHAFLKGFTLLPDFCPEQKLRHQTDIDVLVSPADLQGAGAVFEKIGYSRVPPYSAEESRFATPRSSIPSVSEDLFQLQPHRQAEIHTSIWESAERHHVVVRVPSDCLSRAEIHEYRGVEFSALAADDMFLLQMLHVFRHLLGAWVRLSWLWEVHYCMRRNSGNAFLWDSVCSRGSDDPMLRNACGLTLHLTHQLFGSPIPPRLRQWCADTLPPRMRAWVDLFGVKWALADARGSKLALFVHQDFIADSMLRRRHLLRRLIPIAGRPSLGQVSGRRGLARCAVWLARFGFFCRRAYVHVSDVGPLCVEFARWRRAKRKIAGPAGEKLSVQP